MKAAWLPIAFIFAGAAFSQSPFNKVSSEVQNLDPNSTVNVIVQFDQVPTEAHHNKVRNRGGKLRRSMKLVKAGSYSVPVSALADLANDSSVTHISVDHKIAARMDHTTAAANASAAWQSGWDGTGVGVAVIDSGISIGKDFGGKGNGNSRIVYSQDFTGGTGGDQYGHGTHIAGIIAGNGSNGKCPSCNRALNGMAPNANLIDLRVLDQNGESSDSELIAAISQAIQLKST